MARNLLLAVVFALALAPAASAQDPAASGSFAQLTGEAGCLIQAGVLTDDEEDAGETSLKGCDKGRGLFSANAILISPDGKNAYVASSGTRRYGSNAVVTFARNPDTGKLSFTECVSDDGGDGRLGSDGLCKNGDALLGANDIALSPDGKFAYVSSGWSNGVAFFAREPDSGRLTQLGCVKEFPRQDKCTQAAGLLGPSGVAVSPDGANVYVTSRESDAVIVFARDAETGGMEETGCVSNSGSDGRCVDGTALTGASSVTVSADGATVYVTADEVGAVTWYARDAATGLLTPKGCLVEEATTGGACTSSKSLGGAASATLTPDGGQLIVASPAHSTLSILTRDPATGGLTPSACLQHREPRGDDVIPDEADEFDEELADEESTDDATAARVRARARAAQEDDEDALLPGCVPAKALGSVHEVTVSGDGRAVFATGYDYFAAFSRDPLTGKLTQFACAESYRTYKSCTQARGLSGASGIAASTDARNLYVVSGGTSAVTTYGAVAAVAAPAARMTKNGTAAVRLACPAARTRACVGRIAVAARAHHARGHAFLLAPGRSAAVQVKVPARVRSAVRRHRHARATLVVRDSGRLTRLSGRRITLTR
jgi:DNA-binding beta-propeller fold protein YncE